MGTSAKWIQFPLSTAGTRFPRLTASEVWQEAVVVSRGFLQLASRSGIQPAKKSPAPFSTNFSLLLPHLSALKQTHENKLTALPYQLHQSLLWERKYIPTRASFYPKSLFIYLSWMWSRLIYCLPISSHLLTFFKINHLLLDLLRGKTDDDSMQLINLLPPACLG